MIDSYMCVGLMSILLASLLVSYLFYPVIISFLSRERIQKSNLEFDQQDSRIHVIVCCYNEGEVIEEKIRNCFAIDYPVPYSVYVVVDKSEDDTLIIAKRMREEFKNLYVFDKGYRNGKNDSLNYFYNNAIIGKNDVLFMSDANTFFEKEAFKFLWEDLASGSAAVGGSMVYIDQKSNSAKSEGIYWKYEEWIRNSESNFGRNISMNGGNMAMLAKCYKELPLFAPNDFFIPLSLVSKYKCTFNGKSEGVEKAILHKSEELNRKSRMANRQMSAILYLWNQMSLLTKIQVVFHKIIRWFALVIYFMLFLIALLRDFLIGSIDVFSGIIYFGALMICAVVIFGKLRFKSNILSTLNYAIMVHYFAAKGAIASLYGKKVSTWKKADSNRV
jgi:cellulose synthase/poly-beta-1,6-N-acetylglucosamine synthase-like glycosyltransferase